MCFNRVWRGLLGSLAMLTVCSFPVTAQTTLADEPLAESATAPDMDQVTSVSQLTDVRPTDWAFQALQSLVERYGCIVGYPDRTYRGNRALSRYEFAAGVNACLDRISELIDAAKQDLVTKEDLLVVQRLQEEFAAELATLRGTIDSLDVRTATLERQQFTTTTKLNVSMIWAATDVLGDRVGANRNDTNTILAQRTWLNLETSFTGRDLLRTRIEAANFGNVASTTGTNMTRLNFDNFGTNDVLIPHVLYRTPLGESLSFTAGPAGIGYTDITNTVTPPTIADDSIGIPSKFGEYSPLFRRGGGGFGLNWAISRNLQLTLGYLAADNPTPLTKNGLFDGSFNALAHLFYIDDRFGLGVAYSRSYAPGGKVNLTGDTGSFLSLSPFGDSIATTSDSIGIQGYYRISPNFQVHAWGVYTNASAQHSGLSSLPDGRGGRVAQLVNRNDDADIWYGALGVTFPDIGGRGNLPGLLVGLPPRVSRSDVRRDRDTSVHIEAFYRVRINDYIAITPGFWVVLNPENDSRNDTQWVGFVRTSFNF